MKEYLQKLIDGKNLTTEEAESAMKFIMSGSASEAQIAGFLVALKIKGETPEEIAAFAKVMREFSTKIKPKVDGVLVDMCGTGGDASGTFNISTTAMFVVATQVPVAKHGNRSITSGCGSADVLESLGANINLPPEKIQESIEKVGIGFMFAPAHHSAMKHVMPTRKALGVRIVFNILGPLTNPAGANAQVVGVYDGNLTEKIASVLGLLGCRHAMVVHGFPQLDEISTPGETKISELKNGKIETYRIKPEDFGFKKAAVEDLRGGTPAENAEITKNVLSGKDKGPKRDVVLLNAAAGLVVGGKAKDLKEGLEISKNAIDSGAAYKKLEEFVGFCK